MRVAFGLALILTACTAPPAAPPLASGSAHATAAATSPLLYVSDLEKSVVNVYRIPSLKLVLKLKDFFEPQGECTNAVGDIWIVDTGYRQIDEYAPGATKPMASLGDALDYPSSCAVNPINGDLAVTNLYAGSGSAQLLVYDHATGSPQVFRDEDQATQYFAAYDGKGNLYISGATLKSKYLLSQLRSGSKSLRSMKVSGATIHDAGTVLWNHGELILGDQACRGGKTSCLYVATVSGSTATVKSSIALADSCDVVQVALYQGAVYGGNSECAKRSSSVDSWSYPSGKRNDAITGVHSPIGAAISAPPTGRL